MKEAKKEDKKEEQKEEKKKQTYSFSFYYEGKEYIITTTNPNEAGQLFYQLIKKYEQRDRKA